MTSVKTICSWPGVAPAAYSPAVKGPRALTLSETLFSQVMASPKARIMSSCGSGTGSDVGSGAGSANDGFGLGAESLLDPPPASTDVHPASASAPMRARVGSVLRFMRTLSVGQLPSERENPQHGR